MSGAAAGVPGEEDPNLLPTWVCLVTFSGGH